MLPFTLSRSPLSLFRITEARVFYSSALQRLLGVVRSGKPLPSQIDLQKNGTESWRPFNR